MHMSRTTLTTSGAKFATGLRRRKTATTLDTNVRIILRNRFVLCVAISAFFLPHAGVDPVVKNPPIERAQPACPSDHSGQHGMRPWMTDLSPAKVRCPCLHFTRHVLAHVVAWQFALGNVQTSESCTTTTTSILVRDSETEDGCPDLKPVGAPDVHMGAAAIARHNRLRAFHTSIGVREHSWDEVNNPSVCIPE
jgi:hypothetical protein